MWHKCMSRRHAFPGTFRHVLNCLNPSSLKVRSTMTFNSSWIIDTYWPGASLVVFCTTSAANLTFSECAIPPTTCRLRGFSSHLLVGGFCQNSQSQSLNLSIKLKCRSKLCDGLPMVSPAYALGCQNSSYGSDITSAANFKM